VKGQCRHIRELLSAFIDGESITGETEEMKTHLRDCPACRAYQSLHVAIAKEMKETPDVPPEEVEELLRRIVPAGKKREPLSEGFSFILRPAFAAFVTLLLVVSLFMTFGGKDSKKTLVAEMGEQELKSLPPEERDLLIYMGEMKDEGDGEFLKMLQDLEELDDFFTDEKVNT